MDFTVYSMGDMPIFTGVLNAVAMVFNSSIFDPAQGAGVVVVGMLLGILFMIFPVMAGGKLNPMPFIFTMVLFYGGVVPKERLQVEDIYTGTVTAVDNVPLVVALPASLAATLSRAVTDKVETAFQTASGSYLSMGTQGFANPLKLLLSFRDPKANSAAFPYFRKSVLEFVKYCAPSDPAFSPTNMAQAPGIIDYLAKLNVSGFMTYYSAANASGVITPCPAAQTNLTNDASAIPTGGAAVDVMMHTNAGDYAQGQQLPSTQSFSDAYSTVTAGILGNMQSAQQFMVNAIAFSPAEEGVNCVTQPTGPNAAACQAQLVQTEALERSNIEAAAQASLFAKTAIPAMNVLLVLFYAFSPIIIAVAFMSGPHAVKIITGYMMFGAWTQSWMPVAAVINYIIQMQTQEAFSMLPAAGVTMTNYMSFYKLLEMKIGVASELLAMTPVITMALLTGSMQALTSISNRLGTKDHIDEGTVAPHLAQNDAIVHKGNVLTQAPQKEVHNAGSGIVGQSYYNSDGTDQLNQTLDISKTAAAATAETKSHLDAANENLQRTQQHVLESGATRNTNAQWSEALGHASTTTNGKVAKYVESQKQAITDGKAYGTQDIEALNAALGLKVAGFGGGASKKLSTIKNAELRHAAEKAFASMNEHSRSYTDQDAEEFKKSLATSLVGTQGNKDQEGWSRAVGEQHVAQQQFQEARQRQNSVGLKNSQNMMGLATRFNGSMHGAAGAQHAIEAQLKTDEEREKYQAEYDRLIKQASAGGAVNANMETAARLEALGLATNDGMMNVLQQGGEVTATAMAMPDGTDVDGKNKGLNHKGAAVESQVKPIADKAARNAAKGAHVRATGGAHVQAVNGFAGVTKRLAEEARGDAANNVMGKGDINHETFEMTQKSIGEFQEKLRESNLVNEHGDIAGMHNIAEAAKQWSNFADDHPVAAAAISMLPVGRMLKAAEAVSKATTELKAAEEAYQAVRGVKSAEDMAKVAAAREKLAAEEKALEEARKLYAAKVAGNAATGTTAYAAGEEQDRQ